MNAPVKRLVITIDGPAGSGKSTTARHVARRLGYLHLDSGALYRAVTLAALQREIDPRDEVAVAHLAQSVQIALEPAENGLIVRLDGIEVTQTIRMPDVSRAIGPVAANPGVRAALLKQQRTMGEQGGIVAEGRDMGSVVYPRADLKIFLVASIQARARRRMQELARRGVHLDAEVLAQEISQRDADDSQRNVSPLHKPDDAVEIDTTELTIPQQVAVIVRKAIELGAREA